MGLFDWLRDEIVDDGGEWVPSDPHNSTKTFDGDTHFDVYHVDEDGDRDQPHSTDMQISGEPHAPSMADIVK